MSAFASLLIKSRLPRPPSTPRGHSLVVHSRSSRPAHQPVRVANVGRVAHGDLALDVRAPLRAIPCRPICTGRRTRLPSRPCAALGRHSVSTAKYNLEYEHYLRHRIESGLACPHLALRSLSPSSLRNRASAVQSLPPPNPCLKRTRPGLPGVRESCPSASCEWASPRLLGCHGLGLPRVRRSQSRTAARALFFRSC